MARVWAEKKKLWVVAAPAIFARFSTFGVSIISQAFMGHIGATELAAYTLVFTVILRFANGILGCGIKDIKAMSINNHASLWFCLSIACLSLRMGAPISRVAHSINIFCNLFILQKLLGVSIGSGRQRTVAYINLVCYYCIGIPFGVVLGYLVGLGVKGIWVGMISGTAVQTAVLVVFTVRTDWDQQVAMAQARVKRWSLPENQTETNEAA
ncbi:hypothetical protein Taro_047582 [Colocasia esculenta]|uniref:Uncharacterized protein n=1 Tax=Colocasia esculenta TaxID=4460 RepID=A0A843X149_COLES|nr:hypothetical protein [Colocasia esculenta]